MASADLPKVFCHKENSYFPASEFIDDPKWGPVHNVVPRHTSLGTLIDPPPNQPPNKVRGVLGGDDDDE